MYLFDMNLEEIELDLKLEKFFHSKCSSEEKEANPSFDPGIYRIEVSCSLL